jgi:hypothetical protein
VKRIGSHKTRKAAVTAAFDEYIRRRQQKVISLFGAIDFDPDYDYKAGRNARRS